MAKDPCGDCWLKHSSYCVGCTHEWWGLGFVSFMDWLSHRENSKNAEKGKEEAK